MKLTFKYFNDALTRFKKSFIISFLLIIFSTALLTFLPYATRMFINFNSGSFNLLYFCLGILIFFALYMIINLITVVWNRTLDDFGGKYIANLSERMMTAVSKSSFADLDNIGANNIKHIMYYDNLEIFRVVGYYVPTLINCLVTILAALILSIFFDYKITLFIFLASLLGFIISFFSRRVISTAGKKENIQLKAVNNNVDSFVEAVQLIQTNNLQQHYIANTSASIGEFIKTAKSADSKIYFFTYLAAGYYSVFGIALSAILALPFAGESIVNLVFFTMLANIIISQSQKAETIIFQAIKAQISLLNTEKLLRLKPRQGNEPLDEIKDISFENVCFKYNKDYVLKDFSLNLQSGNFYVLEGVNGSGKSTILKLLMGLYPSESGDIKINGEMINEYAQNAINQQILYCGQDEIFPDGNIKNYMSLISGKEVSDEQYEKLINLVNLADIRDIQGGGENLSGGQRKKLLIIKLLLRYEDSSVLILDEIQAGLDRETSKMFNEFLKNADFSHKTVIFIEHTNKTDFSFAKKIILDNNYEKN